jgi:hypothetical protein
MSVGWESLTFNVKDGFLGEQGPRMTAQHGFCMSPPLPHGLPTPCSVHGNPVVDPSLAVTSPAPAIRCLLIPNKHIHNIRRCIADAVVRGHRSGLLTAADYNNLAQCESLDDIKLNLVRPMARPLSGWSPCAFTLHPPHLPVSEPRQMTILLQTGLRHYSQCCVELLMSRKFKDLRGELLPYTAQTRQ